MSLRQALLVDQLNGCNLLSVEVQFRRLQTIEYSYAEKARGTRVKGGWRQTDIGGADNLRWHDSTIQYVDDLSRIAGLCPD